MKDITCQIIAYSRTKHVSQLLAGFFELKAKGVVELSINRNCKFDTNNHFLEVIINDKYKIIYDTNDGYNFDDNLSLDQNEAMFQKLVESCDFYFKRSFDYNIIQKYNLERKCFPLGLNYFVNSRLASRDIRYVNKKEHLKWFLGKVPTVAKIFKIHDYGSFFINDFEQIPCVRKNPKILFMARTWNPADVSNPLLKDERELMNNRRAECIKVCKKEFRDNFIGGFKIDDYARRNYKECLLPNLDLSNKASFLKLIKDSDICISTSGLHNSIGWKLSEYVAASKAIVSEKLYYKLPGEFNQEKNYLEFKRPEELSSALHKLIKDEHFRYNMMVANFKYYNEYVRPDILILNSLFKVIECSI